jgi:nitrate reductase gamma subunit
VNTISIILIAAAYMVYAAFWVRLGLHTLLLLRAAKQQTTGQASSPGRPLGSSVTAVIDILFFRRLFATNKPLWLGSWVFHLAFFVVILRHLRYFLAPVPRCIVYVQPFGVFAGYVMALSLAYVILLRAAAKTRHLSFQNYLILGLVLLISATGLLMRNYYPPDLVDVKSFAMGLVGMSPAPLPAGFLFSLHFFLVLLLVPFLPFHLFAAPLVILDARIREDALEKVMHDR